MKIISVYSLIAACLLVAGCAADNTKSYDAERCPKLLAEADALQGKPLQHSAAMERYNKECVGN